MAFKPLFRAIMHTARNLEAPIFQNYLSMIPSSRSIKLYNHLSCSTTRSFRTPSFCLLNKGIPSILGKCLSSYSATDDDNHQIRHRKSKKVHIQAHAEEEEGKLDSFVAAEPPLLEDALVQVICEYEASYLGSPFSRYARYRRRATNGFIIEGRRLLTAAHCIEHNSNVSIQKQGSNTIYQAKVIATAHDFNLAMLTVSDDGFWEGVGFVELGDMPSPRDELTTMSYLEGMNTITSRSCFVSDAGEIKFFDDGLELPAFVVYYDSKFEESGSAVFTENGKCVGMALASPESIYQGPVIPTTLIKHFIQNYDRNGGYTGATIFGVKWQKMENCDLRIYMGMQHDQEGVLIIDIDPDYPELQVLKPYDVILSIDGVKIANDGTVPFVRGRRIIFHYLFGHKFMGDHVLVKVLRASEIHEFSIKLAAQRQVVPKDVKGRPQKYYIIGGFVFTSVTIPYVLASFEGGGSVVEKLYGSQPEWPLSPVLLEECVVVSEVLEAEVNKGYSIGDIVKYQVMSLNCEPVEGLKELVSMVESCKNYKFLLSLQNDQMVVLPSNTAKEITPEILKTYGLPCAISDDLSDDMKTLSGKKEDETWWYCQRILPKK